MSHPAAKNEVRLQGIGVSPGISCGLADFVGVTRLEPDEAFISPEEISGEKERFSRALALTRTQIGQLQSQIEATAGSEHASIFDAHLLLLDDNTILDEVLRGVEKDLRSVDRAYHLVISKYADSLRRLSDPYLRERAIDIEDVGQRVLKNLQWPDGSWLKTKISETSSIILAHDLAPSDTVSFDREKVKGFATEAGSATSHTAIMAHSLNIPAVVALHDFENACQPGDMVLLDGFNGLLIINPSKATLDSYAPFIQQVAQLEQELHSLRDVETKTADGRRIILSANIEFVDELETLASVGAEGVGLYRTEFFYMTSPEVRTETSQAENYSEAARVCGDHGVIVRTLDIGGDKIMPDLFEEPQPNPFLGWRGIRVSLDCPEEFKVQLRAILRASVHGKVRVMFPFISSFSELIQANRLLEEAKSELRQRGVAFDESIEKGAMIEIPSAVMIADHLAQQVDFFSIGTNDLVQYATAVDRINDRVANLYRPAHPGVLKLIQLTVEAAHRHGIWCGMCGEAASDLRLTPLWVGLKIDELSVGPAQVLKIRRAISKLPCQTCADLVDEVLTLSRATEILELSAKMAGNFYPELLKSPS